MGITDDVYQWASKQMVVLPLKKEFVSEIINRGTELVTREALACRNAAIQAAALTKIACEIDEANCDIRTIARLMVGNQPVTRTNLVRLESALEDYDVVSQKWTKALAANDA